MTPLDSVASNGVKEKLNVLCLYILESEKDGDFYTGYSKDLKNRMIEHSKGKVSSTKNRLPVRLVYYEACLNQQDATHREKYLKTAWGKRYVKSRLKNYLIGVEGDKMTKPAKNSEPNQEAVRKHNVLAGERGQPPVVAQQNVR